jgi:hypothetical protein
MMANRPGEEDLAWLLSRVTHQLTNRLCAVLEPEGLTLGQWWVLGLLSDGTGHGMGEAADHAMVPAPTLTKAIDQLVAELQAVQGELARVVEQYPAAACHDPTVASRWCETAFAEERR